MNDAQQEFNLITATRDATRERIEQAKRRQAAERGGNAATVIPFPVAKQRRFTDRHLLMCKGDSPAVAYRYLSGVLRRHPGQLERLGVDPERAAKDTAELARAFGLMPGDTARAASQ